MAKTKLLKIFLFFLLIGILLYPSLSFAAGSGIEAIKNGLKLIAEGTELNIGDATEYGLIKTVGNIIKFLLTFLGAAFLILTIWAGAKWMFSMGDPNKVKESLKIIRSASMGLVVIILSYVIVSFVLTIIGKAK